MYTFHPGAPVQLDNVETTPELDGATVTVGEAMRLGFRTANLVTE